MTLLAGVCASAIAFPAFAQSADDTSSTEIIVTAQRSNQRLQDVPIAVSAFNTEALEKQQIKNTSDLQLSLPNVTFTKTNFTGASFTIRGIGDLCVGSTCDSATAIHMNDAPLFGTRLFEGEFYDLAQIEVLRGPQGTLFGRNATSGVVNFRTARPDLTALGANAEFEYGNYESVKVKGMINVPLTEQLAVRVAGYYLNRDGYTTNLYDNTKIDDRDMYGIRGSIRWEPTPTTTINLMGQYFHEDDSRMRAQKQVCQRDPTGVLGCLNGSRPYETTNANSTLAALVTSTHSLGLALGFGSLNNGSGGFATSDLYSGLVNPADPRVVSTAYTPTYFTQETILQGEITQELGGGLELKIQGNYQDVEVDSSQDYNNAVGSRASIQPALNNLAFLSSGSAQLIGFLQTPAGGGLSAPVAAATAAGLQAYLGPAASALMPNGPTGQICTSAPDPSGTGVFGGHAVCADVPLAFDRSNQYQHSWTAEATLSSKWDGPFNFLLGGIYGKFALSEDSFYVNSFGLDFFSGVGGGSAALEARQDEESPLYGVALPSFLASPHYRNHTDKLDITTFGLFGEGYYEINDSLKLTVGLRYNHDKKYVRARTTLFVDAAVYEANGYDYTNNPVLVPIGSDSITDAYGYQFLNFDPARSGGPYEWAENTVKFSALTGRAVLDYQITPDNLLYASYSRGYKSGGINPPLSGNLGVETSFKPEYVNAFEIGSKNTFGKMQLNLTGFYYDYKGLQLSRIVARTSVNDNVDATIYGLEAEAIFRPTPELTLNANASYLHAEVSKDRFIANPRDFGGGRADAVIIKDIENASNCAVAPVVAGTSATATAAFVNAVNTYVINPELDDPLPGVGSFGNPAVTGINSLGAFSSCSAIGAIIGAGDTVIPGAGNFELFPAGVPVNIKGNKLPGAPDYKFSAGAQYAAKIGDLTLTPRADFIYTGKATGSIFGGQVNEIPSYTQVNAQIQLDGPDSRWFVRGWVQNLFDENSITGLYVTDQSSGLFTNIFTLEPRRYGLTAGVKF